MAKKKAKKKAKKPAKRKTSKKKAAKRPVKAKKKIVKPAGKVTHFFNEISVAIVKFDRDVPVGAVLYFKGATTDFKHEIKSMQYDHAPIAKAKKGKEVGIKVNKRVREGDSVHLI